MKARLHGSPHVFLDVLRFFSQRIARCSWGNSLSLLLPSAFFKN